MGSVSYIISLGASVILIPVILALAVFLPGNQFLPLASLAGMFYLFPMVLPFTKGNVVKTLIIGLVTLIIGLYFVTDMAPDFTLAANQVYEATHDWLPISLKDSWVVLSTLPPRSLDGLYTSSLAISSTLVRQCLLSLPLV